MLTDPPKAARTDAAIGISAVPCNLTTAVCPSGLPVPSVRSHEVMPCGRGAAARYSVADWRTDLSDTSIVDLNPAPVQCAGSVQGCPVGRIKQPSAGQLDSSHVDGTDDEHQGDDGKPQNEQTDLATFSLSVLEIFQVPSDRAPGTQT